jgi:hypothetical protein
MFPSFLPFSQHFPAFSQHFPSIFHEKNTDTVHVTPLRLLAESQEPQ